MNSISWELVWNKGSILYQRRKIQSWWLNTLPWYQGHMEQFHCVRGSWRTTPPCQKEMPPVQSCQGGRDSQNTVQVHQNQEPCDWCTCRQHMPWDFWCQYHKLNPKHIRTPPDLLYQGIKINTPTILVLDNSHVLTFYRTKLDTWGYLFIYIE